MEAMAFALSDSAVGVVFTPEDFGVGVGRGRLLRVLRLRKAELLSPCGARAAACAGLTKTPALLVRSPSCAHDGPAQTASSSTAPHVKKIVAPQRFAVRMIPPVATHIA